MRRPNSFREGTAYDASLSPTAKTIARSVSKASGTQSTPDSPLFVSPRIALPPGPVVPLPTSPAIKISFSDLFKSKHVEIARTFEDFLLAQVRFSSDRNSTRLNSSH